MLTSNSTDMFGYHKRMMQCAKFDVYIYIFITFFLFFSFSPGIYGLTFTIQQKLRSSCTLIYLIMIPLHRKNRRKKRKRERKLKKSIFLSSFVKKKCMSIILKWEIDSTLVKRKLIVENKIYNIELYYIFYSRDMNVDRS